MVVKEYDDLSKIRHGLRKRGKIGIFEIDPFGLRIQLHYCKGKEPNLMLFNSEHQDISNDCFGLYHKVLNIFHKNGIKD